MWYAVPLAIVSLAFVVKSGDKKVWDKYSEDRLRKLHPAIRDRVRRAINELYRKGIKVRIASGYRTFAEQDRLYALGRTMYNPDGTVTNARGGYSYHNYGLAVDLCVVTDRGSCLPVTVFPEVIKTMKAYGFEWGGDWRKKDVPHFQLKNLPSVGTLYARYKKGQRDLRGFVKI